MHLACDDTDRPFGLRGGLQPLTAWRPCWTEPAYRGRCGDVLRGVTVEQSRVMTTGGAFKFGRPVQDGRQQINSTVTRNTITPAAGGVPFAARARADCAAIPETDRRRSGHRVTLFSGQPHDIPSVFAGQAWSTSRGESVHRSIHRSRTASSRCHQVGIQWGVGAVAVQSFQRQRRFVYRDAYCLTGCVAGQRGRRDLSEFVDGFVQAFLTVVFAMDQVGAP